MLLEDIKPYERMRIENSVIRNDKIVKLFEENERISKNDLKGLLSTSYPDGLCCHYYKEFFGWQTFTVGTLDEKEIEVILPQEKANPDFYKMI